VSHTKPPKHDAQLHGFFSDGISLVFDKKDNVAVLLRQAKKGTKIAIEENTLPIKQDIPFGHKVAIKNIPKDGYIIKYGIAIGRAKSSINAGEHVHVHNVEDITWELREKTRAKLKVRE